MDTARLLTPEFVEFSQKIADIFWRKEQSVSNFKQLYKQHKEEVAALEAEAQALRDEFENKSNG